MTCWIFCFSMIIEIFNNLWSEFSSENYKCIAKEGLYFSPKKRKSISMIISNIWAQLYIYRNVKNHSFDKLIQFWKGQKNCILSFLISTFLYIYALSPKSEKYIARIKYVLCDNYKSLIFILVGSSTCQFLNT